MEPPGNSAWNWYASCERGIRREGLGPQPRWISRTGPPWKAPLAQFDAEIVFNSAAYNQVDVAEKEPQAAFLVNALAVRNLALACRQVDARLVHFSTDYVFDGAARHPYTEDDPTHPLGAYAVSKLAGEFYAQAYLDQALVVRTSGVFGPGGLDTARGNFVELMLRLAASGQPDPRGGRPRGVAHFRAAAGRAHHRSGGARISPASSTSAAALPFPGSISPALIFEAAGIEPMLLATNEREYRTPARRPRYSALSNAKMERAGLQPMPPTARGAGRLFRGSGSRERLVALRLDGVISFARLGFQSLFDSLMSSLR